MRALDLGSGTGYPALLAAQIVGPSGGVVGVDLPVESADEVPADAIAHAEELVEWRDNP